MMACGGKRGVGEGTPPGQSTNDIGGFDQTELGEEPYGDGGVPLGDAGLLETAPVIFRMVNTSDIDLVFSIDHGWQPNVLPFYGVKPNAVSIIPFPKHCTAACDAEELCPVCEEPTKPKEVREAEQRVIVPPGESYDLPWDGEEFIYQRTGPKRRGCECYTKAPAPPQEYTVRACGLRLTTTPKQPSKLQCVDAPMTLPFEGQQIIEFQFPKAP